MTWLGTLKYGGFIWDWSNKSLVTTLWRILQIREEIVLGVAEN